MKIGLLGGGQLGRMLLQEAMNWNLDISILDPDENAPCKFLTSSFSVGDLTDYQTVLNFGKNCDLITIEIENVNADALMELERSGVQVYPQPNVLKVIQDKGLQKMFYHQLGIPTAEFILCENKEDVLACDKFFPFVQKLRKGGYDGKGVIIHQSKESLQQAFDAPSILEVKADIKMEISVIVARNAEGQVVTYDAVECMFDPKLNLVDILVSPAAIDHKLEEQAQALAVRIITEFKMVGILAVEFFVTNDNQLLVNEIAPRPHNSGHHTIEACTTSQFEQHLRSILNMPLGSTQQILPAAMVNIIGAEGFAGEAQYKGLENLLAISNIFVHLYGKKVTKPGRKMGHATILGNSTFECVANAQKVKELLTVIA
jgi:5-(carboxyamino)imidazole ribonucleotide synthase